MIPTDLVSSWQRVEVHVIHYTNVPSFNHKTRLKEGDLAMVLLAQQNLQKDRRPRKPKKKKEDKTRTKQETTLQGRIEKQDSKL
jgi:hypothetical protein